MVIIAATDFHFSLNLGQYLLKLFSHNLLLSCAVIPHLKPVVTQGSFCTAGLSTLYFS